ncbi:sialidase family protein [Streptomyces niveus]|uniref:sialidase family protein n=1 Tax=Streptomyces niveus TaxID=193462 RepID=UPI0034211AE9
MRRRVVGWAGRLVVVGLALVMAGCRMGSGTGSAGAAGAGAGAAAGECGAVDVFVSGRDGYDTFRIPAVVAVREPGAGRAVLVAFAEGRRLGKADHGDVDVVHRRSYDGGCTWSELRPVADAGQDTLGNPVPVAVGDDGRLVLLTTRNAGAATESAIMTGQVETRDGRRVFVQSSADAGATWSAPREITGQVKRPDWRWYATGPGHGVELTAGPHAGRLVVGANHSVAPADGSTDTGAEPRHYAGHCLLSDDGGETWRIGYVDPAGDGTHHVNETAVAQLPDGTVYFNARDQKGSAPGNRVHAWSRDGGATLAEPFDAVASITAPPVQGSLLQPAGAAAGAPLLMAAPADPGDRASMTVRASADGGATWSAGHRLSDAKAAYSDLVQLDGEHVGILYETGRATAYETIRFTPLPLTALTAP